MGLPRGAKWWIPALGLILCATALTAGFGWTIARATHGHAVDALESAGIVGVTVENDYRDVTLNGPAALEDDAVAVVERARLVQDVTYVGADSTEPSPSPSPSPSPTPHPFPSPSPPPPPDLQRAIDDLEDALSGRSVYRFAFDSAQLTPGARGALDAVAAALTDARAESPRLRLSIAGHTDSTGDAAYNQRLSVDRADAVRDYLVSQGVAPGALVAVGYGESKPVASNATVDGRARNRRVEVTILEG